MPTMEPVLHSGDPDWRNGWLETVSEPLERYSRINEHLLHGCEEAYTAIADEFHSDQPDFEKFVDSGALDPELARFLDDAIAKYRTAGYRPVLEHGRVNGECLLVDSTASEMVCRSVVDDMHASFLPCNSPHATGRLRSHSGVSQP